VSAERALFERSGPWAGLAALCEAQRWTPPRCTHREIASSDGWCVEVSVDRGVGGKRHAAVVEGTASESRAAASLELGLELWAALPLRRRDEIAPKIESRAGEMALEAAMGDGQPAGAGATGTPLADGSTDLDKGGGGGGGGGQRKKHARAAAQEETKPLPKNIKRGRADRDGEVLAGSALAADEAPSKHASVESAKPTKRRRREDAVPPEAMQGATEAEVPPPRVDAEPQPSAEKKQRRSAKALASPVSTPSSSVSSASLARPR
jgi:hypothetical protein